MAKTVIFMRHGKAADIAGYHSDFDRPLVKRGFEETALAAKKLKIAGFVPEVLIASPAQRTKDTAESMRHVFGINKDGIQTVDALYHGSPRDYLDAIAHTKENTVMIVGHNPTIGQLCMYFSRGAFAEFPTSACAVFRFESHAPDINSMAELMFFDLRK